MMGDDQDWLAEIADVTPLDNTKISDRKPTKDTSCGVRKIDFSEEKEQYRKQHPKAVSLPDNPVFGRFATISEVLGAARPSVPQKTYTKLKKGGFFYQAVLDLHGKTELQAHDQLCKFLDHAAASGLKCVLVIHGKGMGRGGEVIGVLKARMSDWLTSHPCVIAFHSALPKHGGTGAVYILMRRVKK